MKEFYVKFKGKIMVQARNWNEDEKEALKRFPEKGIIIEKVISVRKREYQKG